MKYLVILFTTMCCIKNSYAQKITIDYKNYEAGQILVPDDLDIENINPYPFDRYLISTDAFGKYKPIERKSSLYKYLLDIDIINGWKLFRESSLYISKEEFFDTFPKNSRDAYWQKYPISKYFQTYVLKLVYNPMGEQASTLTWEQVFLINIKNQNIVNISIVSFKHSDHYTGSEEYTINLGKYFYFTSEELFSDVITVPDMRIFNKPLFQKFRFNESGHLEVLDKSNN